MDKGIQVEARTHEVENAFTDKVACGWACVRAEMCSNERLPTCEKGLPLYKSISLPLVFRLGAKIKPYAYLARQLEAQFGMTRTPESIRGVVNRLAARGYLRHRLAREGTLRGVRFSVIEELLCPALVNPVRAAACDVHYAARSGERQTHQAIPSILEEKERKNLSISSQQEEDKTRLEALTEEDIKFHWPKLAGYGFSTDQIRQIIQRLGQKEKSFTFEYPAGIKSRGMGTGTRPDERCGGRTGQATTKLGVQHPCQAGLLPPAIRLYLATGTGRAGCSRRAKAGHRRQGTTPESGM